MIIIIVKIRHRLDPASGGPRGHVQVLFNRILLLSSLGIEIFYFDIHHDHHKMLGTGWSAQPHCATPSCELHHYHAWALGHKAQVVPRGGPLSHTQVTPRMLLNHYVTLSLSSSIIIIVFKRNVAMQMLLEAHTISYFQYQHCHTTRNFVV